MNIIITLIICGTLYAIAYLIINAWQFHNGHDTHNFKHNTVYDKKFRKARLDSIRHKLNQGK